MTEIRRRSLKTDLASIAASIEVQSQGVHNWHQGSAYVAQHELRFVETFKLVASLRHQTVLSLGAGSCIFEELLLRRGVASSVTAIDLPEAIEAYGKRYDALGIKGVAFDLTAPILPDLWKHSLILANEILEHLRMDPRHLLRWASTQLVVEGRILITTPNGRSLTRVIKHLMGVPFLPDPAVMFARGSYETEGLHVREYMPIEVVRLAKDAGLAIEKHEFVRAVPVHKILFPTPLKPLLRPFWPFQALMLKRDTG